MCYWRKGLSCRKGYGKTVSAWFNERYKKKCDIQDTEEGRKKDFHSFRDTFITHVAHKKERVAPELLSQTVGHSRGKTETFRTYTEDFREMHLYDEVISKVSFHEEIDLSHLKSSKYVPK